MTTLFDPVTIGRIELANRIVMAPMTRSRADEHDAPTDLHVEYYRQRAGAGLVISEGTQPSADGKGYCRTPGIHAAHQVQAWKRVTDAVRAAGSHMVMQLMHCGRIASRYNKAPGARTVAPSAIRARVQMYTDAAGMQDCDEPHALTTVEVGDVVAEYRQATANALQAGFEGIELHAASGYLPMQFLSTGSNRRMDRYGGPAENRVRFVVETLQAMIEVAGADRVGLRICPGNPFNDIEDADPAETYATLMRAVKPLKLAYLHLIHLKLPTVDGLALAREIQPAPIMINESLTFESAQQYVADGTAVAASFGRYFVANPDLVDRWRRGGALAPFDRKTLYSPGAKGFIDYPALG